MKGCLKFHLSPEQIPGQLAKEQPSLKVFYNTIYRMINELGWQCKLARKDKPYRARKDQEAGTKLIPNRVDIYQRPAHVVDAKEEMGHWEGDTVYGQGGYLVTLTERVSKTLLMCRVKNKTKKAVLLLIMMGSLPIIRVLRKRSSAIFIFAKPYHSWQRGLNENTNGLIRRFYPKGFAIGKLTEQEIHIT